MIDWNSLNSIKKLYPNFLEACLVSLPIDIRNQDFVIQDEKNFIRNTSWWFAKRKSDRYFLYTSHYVYLEKNSASTIFSVKAADLFMGTFDKERESLFEIDNFLFYCTSICGLFYLNGIFQRSLEIKSSPITVSWNENKTVEELIPIQRKENLVVELPSIRKLLED